MRAPERIGVARDGYLILYHQGEDNRCPGCGQQQWHVGRSSAQCAFCDTALPLAAPVATDTTPIEPQTSKKDQNHAVTS